LGDLATASSLMRVARPWMGAQSEINKASAPPARATLGPHDSRERPLCAVVNHLRNVVPTCGNVDIRRLPRTVFSGSGGGSVSSNPTGGRTLQAWSDLRKRASTGSRSGRSLPFRDTPGHRIRRLPAIGQAPTPGRGRPSGSNNRSYSRGAQRSWASVSSGAVSRRSRPGGRAERVDQRFDIASARSATR
jgi:hypothetical protein